MKTLTLLILIFLTGTLKSLGQVEIGCAVKIGSNYYINCQQIISFNNHSVLTITPSNDNQIKINFDVFSTSGTKIATVKDGKLVVGNKDAYIIKSTDIEFSFIEKSTNRIICYVKKINNQQQKRCELHVSADMYMPSGFYFQCTPETTNVPTLNYITGNTIKNAGAAIVLTN